MSLPRIGKNLTATELAAGLRLVFEPERLLGVHSQVHRYMDCWALYAGDLSTPPTHMAVSLEVLQAVARGHGALSVAFFKRGKITGTVNFAASAEGSR